MIILTVDTETTCLVKDSDDFHIIQLSWIMYNTHTEESVENDFVLSVPVKILNSHIHRITDKISSAGYKFSEIIGIFMEDLNASDIICGHNLCYDINSLEIELYRLEMDAEIDMLYEKPFRDTMKLGVGVISSKYPKLSELYIHYHGVMFEDAHNSLADVRATLACYLKLTEILK